MPLALIVFPAILDCEGKATNDSIPVANSPDRLEMVARTMLIPDQHPGTIL
jgi:hypothetical protein